MINLERLKLAAPGLIVELDENTDNVLVHDGTLGFCVTRCFLLDHSIEQIEAAVRAKVSSLRIEEIRKAGLRETVFDEIHGAIS